jgi:hypothetical protein
VIKTKGRDGDGNPLLVFGLSGDELRRLRQGWSQRIDLAEVGLDGAAVFFYDSTEPARSQLEDPATHPIHWQR